MDRNPPDQKTPRSALRILRALGAIVALGVMVCVFPWILLTWGAWDEIRIIVSSPSWLLQRDDGHLVLGVLTLAGVIAWVILVCSIAIEVVHAARSRLVAGKTSAEPARVLRWGRAIVRPLVSAVFALIVIGGGIQATADDGAHPAIVTVDQRDDEDDVLTPEESPEVLWHLSSVAEILEPNANTPVTASPQEDIYQVQPGDSLWLIAEQVYGDGGQWTRIAVANEDLLGGVTDVIHVGWKLKIPSNTPPPHTCDAESVVVEKGDTLWGIAEEHLGDGQLWSQIAQTNPQQISHPNHIEPGWTLDLPCEVWEPPSDPNHEPSQQSPPPSLVPQEYLHGEETHPEVDEDTTVSSGVLQESQGESALDHSTPDTAVVIDLEADEDGTQQWSKAIGVSTALAGGMALMLGRRRLAQLRARPVGRRIVHPTQASQTYASVLGRLGNPVPSPRAITCDEASDGEVFATETGLCDPGEPMIAYQNVSNPEKPVDLDSLLHYGETVVVSIGEDERGLPVIAEVSGGSPFLVTGRDHRDLMHVMCGIAMNIATEECVGAMDLHVVTGIDIFDTFESVHCHRSFTTALTSIAEIIGIRQEHLGDNSWHDLRDDPTLQEAWRPIIFIVTDPICHADYQSLAESFAGPDVGVAAMVTMLADDLGDTALEADMSIESSDHATVNVFNTYVHPHQLTPRRELQELLDVSLSVETTPAWWSAHDLNDDLLHQKTPQVASTSIPALVSERYPETMDSPLVMTESGMSSQTLFNHPTLKLLGPIALEGARGDPPLRAERSCMEYCGWLLEHPGCTAMAMAQGLVVSEGTRRSNMSRLRGWLGHDDENKPYLPEAYSGRIWLDAAVGSDWDRMRMIIGHGIEEVSTDDLIQALSLVRGAPLADATPGQWGWAEELRTDMVSLIRDIGVVATHRCLERNDIDGARWVASRALVAAPEDERLLAVRILTEHNAGNRFEVERLASWVIRNARNLCVDVFPETTTILQHVLGATSPPLARL
ncbi:MAG: LysM peptidoglycan-binding domain-containing protein [Propionibacteriaceae bacterium]|nr:LysM peptidoglycan-binding domain-containing protein [Propionibacteriaceae bacterium]